MNLNDSTYASICASVHQSRSYDVIIVIIDMALNLHGININMS